MTAVAVDRKKQKYLDVTPITWDLSSESGFKTDDEVFNELIDTCSSPKWSPPLLPSVAMELMSMSSRSDVEVEDVVKLLERDALLAARVMQIARSPLYSPQMELRALKPAVVRLGLNAIRNIAMEVSLTTRVFKAPVYSAALERIHKHSTVVAYFARLVARQTFIDPEFAFLCGLLHEVGFSVALVALADPARKKPAPPLDTVWPAVDALHERIASKLSEKWQLPQEIRLVIERHHSLTMGGVVHPVAAIIALADELAFDAKLTPVLPEGHEVHVVDSPDEKRRLLAFNALQLDDKRFGLVREEAKKLAASL